MKIVIESACIKREVLGSFSVCGQPDDLRHIAEQLLAQAERLGGFGWVIIPDRLAFSADTVVRKWEE